MMELAYNFPFASVVLCLLAAVVCSVLGRRASRILTLTVEALLLVMSVWVLIYTYESGEPFRYNMGHFDAPWSNQLRAGVLEAIAAVTFSAVLLLSHAGGVRYIKTDITEKKQNLYCSLLNLVGAALMAMAYTNDLFTGYVFLEILTLASCGILVIRRAGRTTLAATRYMILNLMGSGLFLLGVVLFYSTTGHLLMEYIGGGVKELDASGEYAFPLTVTIGLVCAGLGIKSGLFPFHTWMPDTYGTATPTSSAILSGIISKGYIFLLIKIIWRVIGVGTASLSATRHILLALGLCGIIWGSISAMRQRHMNRMIAYSSAAQIGYIFVGIGLGGIAGFTAAMFQIFAHAVTKPLLFLSGARLSEASSDSELFRDLQGSAERNRIAGFAFTVGALSMTGIPSLAGFTAKLFFADAATEHTGWMEITVLAVLAVSTLLNALYFVRTVIRIYTPYEHRDALADDVESAIPDTVIPTEEYIAPRDAGLVVSAVGFIVLIIALGIFPGFISGLISSGLSMFS